jgi:hypothetical protein
MSMKSKWLAISTLLFGGATIFQGCLGDFWQGFWQSGWPTNNRMLNIAFDVLNEELFG